MFVVRQVAGGVRALNKQTTLRVVRSSRNMASATAIKEKMIRLGVNSVLEDMEIGLDEPTAALLQPLFDPSLRGRSETIDPDLLRGVSNVDPFSLVQNDIQNLSNNLKEILGSDHPVLSTVANYFFTHDGGKKVRPALVLLMSRAASAHAKTEALMQESPSYSGSPVPTGIVLPSQNRLAEITEMIHTASLLHDDVLDMADTRRGVESVNQSFGNKLAVLGGDFLLARSSICLARLRNVEVLEVLATTIEHLVKGEVMQMKSENDHDDIFEYYLRKNYFKTGSLMANSILAATILGGHSEATRRVAFDYGVAVGQAFQLVDDALDFEGSFQTLGKPALADLKQGFATAPVLFALEQYPQLKPMIERKFSGAGDIDLAAEYVVSSGSIPKTRMLANTYIEQAIRAIKQFHPSPERDALIQLALIVANRSK